MDIFKSNPFQPTANLPLYKELYAHLRAAIHSGELKDGMKIPSTRALADELNISRNTVLNAYRQLLAEGYLESREGSGTFVAHVLPDLLLTAPHPDWRTPKTVRSSRAASPQPSFSERAKAQIAFAQPTSEGSYLVRSSRRRRPWMPFPISSGRDWLSVRQGGCLPVIFCIRIRRATAH